jgi:diacylglycerol kinase family enzyme
VISVAVVAHAGKTFGGGLDELRAVHATAGHRKPIWYEVAWSRLAPKAIRRAVKDGAELIFVWGGDGMVQGCIDALRRPDVAIAILPAGTGNLLATSLGISKDIAKAVHIGLHGRRRRLDVGVITQETAWQWVKVLVHEATGQKEDSPQVETRRGKKIVIEPDRKRPYELDGGAAPAHRRARGDGAVGRSATCTAGAVPR